MKARPDWSSDGRDWPLRQSSRFVPAAGLVWHVQILGQGPVMLLVHGTGAASHSWRHLAPLLADRFTLVMPDLPGHGFSEAIAALPTLPALAARLAALLAALRLAPSYAVGHSAGVAILLRMAIDHAIAPRHIVSLNGALRPFTGIAGLLYPVLAKLLFLNPLAAPLLAWRAADPDNVARVIAGTGSHLDRTGIDLYARLLRTNRHVAATLAMMANWDLLPLRRDLPRLVTPTTLLVAGNDRAVPPQVGRDLLPLLPAAKLVMLAGLGHLAHEENAALVAAEIEKVCI